jgi:hypothetical protein
MDQARYNWDKKTIRKVMVTRMAQSLRSGRLEWVRLGRDFSKKAMIEIRCFMQVVSFAIGTATQPGRD